MQFVIIPRIGDMIECQLGDGAIVAEIVTEVVLRENADVETKCWPKIKDDGLLDLISDDSELDKMKCLMISSGWKWISRNRNSYWNTVAFTTRLQSQQTNASESASGHPEAHRWTESEEMNQ